MTIVAGNRNQFTPERATERQCDHAKHIEWTANGVYGGAGYAKRRAKDSKHCRRCLQAGCCGNEYGKNTNTDCHHICAP
jgi:hypothetical protein